MIYLLGQWRLVYAQISIRHMIGIMRHPLVHDCEGDQERCLNVMQMTDMPITMMWGMGLIWLLVIIFLVLGIAAFIKYLRS